MKPDLDAVAEGFDTVDLVVIDAAADPEAAKALRVFGSPTLIAVRDGVELARFTGRRTRAELENLFQETAAGDPATLARTSHSDRVVGTVAGVGVAGVGLAPRSLRRRNRCPRESAPDVPPETLVAPEVAVSLRRPRPW